METTERSFDTNVQLLKYKVNKGVVEHFDKGTLESAYRDIPLAIAPGPKPTMRCCVYKERAILADRVKLAMGGNADNPNVIEVIEIACDECPMGGYEVITWEKDDPDEPVKLYNEDGEELLVNRGKTFFQICTTSMKDTTEIK